MLFKNNALYRTIFAKLDKQQKIDLYPKFTDATAHWISAGLDFIAAKSSIYNGAMDFLYRRSD